jgi:DNA-directed RNA polymerase specialized sigma24 family protein
MSAPMQRQTRQTRETRPAGALREAAPSQDAEDLALMAAVGRAEREALGHLYDRHAPLLLALGLRLLGERASAEQAVHDLFVQVWHHAREFDASRVSVRTWLVGRMRALSLTRRAVPATGEVLLRGGIAGLPAELGAVLELTYFAGLPVPLAAVRLGIPPELVKDRLSRALALLRQRVSTPEEGTS